MVILWLGPLFESLTKNCLASIVIVALKSLLFQLKDFFNLWKINKLEAVRNIISKIRFKSIFK
jgi:solute carrier family 26, other